MVTNNVTHRHICHRRDSSRKAFSKPSVVDENHGRCLFKRSSLRPFVFCLSSGQSILYFEFGQDRLAEAHALKVFELGQGAIEVPFRHGRVPSCKVSKPTSTSLPPWGAFLRADDTPRTPPFSLSGMIWTAVVCVPNEP